MDMSKRRVNKYVSLAFAISKKSNANSSEDDEERTSFSFVHPSCGIPDMPFTKKRETTYIMKDIFFAWNCKKNEVGTRTLLLNGAVLETRIGRRLKDWDIPYLAIYLTKNNDVTKLHLPSNEIDSTGFMSLIQYIITHPYIDELDLRNNYVGDLGVNYMYRQQDKLKLCVLRLSGNKISVEGSKIIAMMIAENMHIKHLDVAGIDQTESSLVYFTSVLRSGQQPFNETLKILNLSRPIPQCRYYKFDSLLIAGAIGLMLQNNANLEELYLQKFNFSCHDIEEMIECAKSNMTLKLLDLSNNNIGDFGAKWISIWLQKRPKLRTLLISCNIISNDGISELAKGIKLSKLVRIDISYNRFDDVAGVELLNSFRKSPFLESFRIFGNNIAFYTAQIIEKLLLANIIKQENIDVRPYQQSVCSDLHLAYYQRKNE